MIDFIQNTPLAQLGELHCLRIDLHSGENYGMTLEDYDAHHQAAADWLLLDFDAFLQIYFDCPSFITQAWQSEAKLLLAQKLLTSNLQMVALNLRAKHWFKLIYALWNDVPPSPNAFMDAPYDNLSSLHAEQREKILRETFDNYCRFSQSWAHSPLFWKIYARPHKQAIAVASAAEAKLWQQLLHELACLFSPLQRWMNPLQIVAAFQFWLRPLSFLPDPLQAAMPDLVKLTVDKSRQYHPAIETEAERIGTMIDIVGSTYGCIFLWENRKFLSFPVFDAHLVKAESFEKELYERFSDAMGKHQDHPKYQLLLSVSQGKETLSCDERLNAFKYLLYYSGNLFKGNVTELVALVLVKQAMPRLFGRDDLLCIPGSAVQVGNRQAADGIIARLEPCGDGCALQVFGLIEVKAYPQSERRLLAQLEKHEQRLSRETLTLFTRVTENNAYFTPETGLDPRQKAQVLPVSQLSFAEGLRYIAVLPHAGLQRMHETGGLTRLYMPWTQAGIRLMSYRFMEWMISNLARTVDPDDYDLGRQNWLKALDALLDTRLLNTKLQNQVAVVEKGLAEGWENADGHLINE